MSLKIESVRFVPDPVLFREFKESPNGVVGSDLRRRGRRLVVLAQGSVQKRTGRLARSINMRYFPARNPYIMVGSDKKTAYWMHEGTDPHVIEGQRTRTMRFKIRGRVVYARQIMHPGTRGSKFLSRHLRTIVND